MVYENILLRFFLCLVFSIFKALFIQLSFLIVFGISYPHSIKKQDIKTLIGFLKGQKKYQQQTLY